MLKMIKCYKIKQMERIQSKGCWPVLISFCLCRQSCMLWFCSLQQCAYKQIKERGRTRTGITLMLETEWTFETPSDCLHIL